MADGTPTGRSLDRASRWLSRHRRPVAAGCAALAVAAALGALRPPAPPTTSVVVAARDLAAGHRLASADLRVADVPSAGTAPGTMSDPKDVDGRVLAVPMQAGEPVTRSRVSSPESLAVQTRALGSGVLAVPVRLGEPATTDLLRPGDVVDVWAARAASTVRGLGDDPAATGSGDQAARRVAAAVRVLAVPRSSSGGGLLDGGDAAASGVVVLAVPPAGVGALAQAAATDRLSVAVLPAPAGGG